ncbi:MAG: AtpZ/AtpI family protein [Erysipelotrichales bacterium]|nr:AtpZ/AtpI family protein [Erysipelotrichales bacterium]
MSFWKAAAMGMTIVSEIAAGLLIGYFLDVKFQSEPVCLIIGVFLGTAAAFMWLYRLGKENAG